MKNFLTRVLYLVIVGQLLCCMTSLNAQNSEATGRRIIIDGKEFFLHVIQGGEGLYSIARQYNVSQQEILEANPRLEGQLQKGQILRIPVIVGRNSNDDELKKSSRFILHTIEKGQTVWYISQKYGVRVEDIYRNNPGSRQALIVGSIIKVPVVENRSVSPTQSIDDGFLIYEIKPGDTLYSLSHQYGVGIEDILQYNPGVRNGILVTGSLIRIPVKKQETRGQGTVSSENKASHITGDKYIYHEIQPGQTLFSISRRYQTDVDEIKYANPGLNPNELKPGYMLRIPRQEKQIQEINAPQEEDDLFEFHKVRRKETLFSISRRYNVDMDILKTVNPQVDYSNLRKGVVLKIPTDQWFVLNHPGQPDQQEEISLFSRDSLLLLGMVDRDSLCNSNGGIGSVLRPAKMAILLPFDLNATDKANMVEKIKNGDTIKTVRQNPILARRSMVFEEFYEGVLLALDQLKEKGINVEVSVFDIASNRLTMKEFLNVHQEELSAVDLIIGPARSENLKPISDFAAQHEIKLVYPLSNVNPELYKNPYVFQVNTPDTLVFDKMATEIVRQSENFNLLAIIPEGEDEYASGFLQKLRQKVFYNEFALNKSINYLEYQMAGKSDQTNLEALLDPSTKNYVVVPTNDEATISKIVPTLSGISEKHKVPIYLFGMTEWLRAQSIEPEDMFNLHAQIFTFFAFDYDRQSTNQFIAKYRRWYHTEPHAVSSYFQNPSASSGYSRYGAWGYDVAYYFLSALTQRGPHFEYCNEPTDVQLVQFNFSFKRISNWGGLYNDGLFLLKFLPDYKVKRVPLLSLPSPVLHTEEKSFPSF
ncbi:LysM peptidoglycan-binding domain-containing protein [Thermophagus sp. OGC60D27]|uniref:LysM peptidoglycan-binding domain-containing protein n=1 Tax=Thermophagus sp. OGC60D27 TaxID=3458415 RepID=UPI004037B4C7